MRTAFFVVLLVTFTFIGGFLGYYLGYQHLLPRLSFVPALSPTPVPSRVAGAAATPSASISATITPSAPHVAPQTVVDTFMKSFTQIKTTTTNDPNAQNAKNLLTQDAQKVVSEEASGSLVSGLAKFAGVQSVPDGGYTLGKPVVSGNTVTVATTWNFLSGPVIKVFYLVNESNEWKIDTIRDK